MEKQEFCADIIAICEMVKSDIYDNVIVDQPENDVILAIHTLNAKSLIPIDAISEYVFDSQEQEEVTPEELYYLHTQVVEEEEAL